jgi:hypothetical protein
VTSSLKSNLTNYPALPEHKKVISKWDGNQFMRHSHFCALGGADITVTAGMEASSQQAS